MDGMGDNSGLLGSVEDERLFYQVFLHDGDTLVEDRDSLQALSLAVCTFAADELLGYIWQRDAFSVSARQAAGDVPAHVGGSMRFGDNVEDEWAVIAVLFKLSHAMRHVVVRLWDTDGEVSQPARGAAATGPGAPAWGALAPFRAKVLLIEAAEELPAWLEPESSDNRIFVSGGRLHIVPRSGPSQEAHLPREPSLLEGLGAVRAAELRRNERAGVAGMVIDTFASDRIQRVLSKRFAGYPARAVAEGRHRVRCVVPEGVARLAEVRPQLIAAAVHALYTRGPEDVRAATSRARFGRERMVPCTLRMTRCLYAQLAKQAWHPPKGVVLPPQTHPDFRAHEAGMKLAAAFEMLYARAPGPADEPACFNTMASAEGVCAGEAHGERWERFLVGLGRAGYFRGELQGSRVHRELLAAAQQFYTHGGAGDSRNASAAPHRLDKEMDRILAEVPASRCDAGEEAATGGDDDKGDSEEWLDLAPEDLDKILAAKTADANESDGGQSEDAAGEVEALVRGMEDFVQKVSSYKGAETPGKSSASVAQEEKANDAVEPTVSDEKCVRLDSERFLDVLRRALGGEEESSGESDGSEGWDESEGVEEEEASTSAASGRVAQGRTTSGQDAEEGGLEDLGMDELMALMDKELEVESPLKDFERQSRRAGGQSLPSGSAGRELSGFDVLEEDEDEDEDKEESDAGSQGGGSEEDELPPVDVEVNLVKNVLASYQAQSGTAGPASNLYGLLGLKLPDEPRPSCQGR